MYVLAMPQARQRTVWTVAFYVGVATVFAGILLQLFPMFLPDSVASRIGHNSEALLLALIIAAWVQFVRPRLTGTRREWAITASIAILCLALGLFLLLTALPSRFRTLNEPLLAAALLVPYVQLRRPLPGRLALWLAVGVFVVTVAFNRTALVTDLAETLAAFILAPLALDVVDRGILDPTAKTSRPARYGWYAFLVLAPIVFSVLQYQVGFGGLFGEGLRYSVRIAEVFITLLLVELYATVIHGRTGRESLSNPTWTPAPARS
jgi:hypothetical protein